MTSAELDTFLHQLHDSVTAMHGLAQLAIWNQSPSISQSEYLENLLLIAGQTASLIQTEMVASQNLCEQA